MNKSGNRLYNNSIRVEKMKYKVNITNPLLLVIICILLSANLMGQDIYMTLKGSVSFVSDAPLEIIKAESSNLNGAIDLADNRFAFKVEVKTLKGFNSALQQEHFYENYMETEKYPYATFQGKIIEKVDLGEEKPQFIRAKGILYIHGVEQERIIQVELLGQNNSIKIKSTFDVSIEDHNIRIPSIVNKKIAEVISVEVDAILKPKK